MRCFIKYFLIILIVQPILITGLSFLSQSLFGFVSYAFYLYPSALIGSQIQGEGRKELSILGLAAFFIIPAMFYSLIISVVICGILKTMKSNRLKKIE